MLVYHRVNMTNLPPLVSRVSVRFQGTRNHTLRRRGFAFDAFDACDADGAATGRSMVAMCEMLGLLEGYTSKEPMGTGDTMLVL